MIAAGVAACALWCACGHACGSGQPGDDRGVAGDAPAPSPGPGRGLGRDRLFVHSASRCGECHGSAETEWARSAHARSATAPGYLAMRAQAAPSAPDCEPCHQPLAVHVAAGASPGAGPRDPVLVAAAAEGVTCDVCHTIVAVELDRDRGSYVMRLDSRTKYGPLCDAKEHYFHTMACSPLHQSAEFCGGCHQLVKSMGPGAITGMRPPVPIYTTYGEWQASEYAADGVSCQSCHMPGRLGEVAVGAGEREGVSEHDFLDDTLLGRAATLRLRIAPRPEPGLRIDYEIHNSGAGHSLPTGLPARRLVLRARLMDASGRVTAQAEARFGRVLVDGRGQVVPFVRAMREAKDTRIAAGERRLGHLMLEGSEPASQLSERSTAAGAAPGAPAVLDIELVIQDFAPEIAAALGLGAATERVLVRHRRDLPEPGAGPGPWIMVQP